MTEPSIVGIAQLRHLPGQVADSREPLDLMEQAARSALADAHLSAAASKSIDKVVIIRPDSWRYDPTVGQQLADRIGLGDVVSELTKHGGHQPVLGLDRVYREIRQGSISAALICGAEAYASRRHYTQDGRTPPWTAAQTGPQRSGLEEARATLERPSSAAVMGPSHRALNEAERHGLLSPIRMYPLYENAFKAAQCLTFEANQQWSARIYARMSQIAARNPTAWNQTPRSSMEIATVTARNRMICFPYTLLMNAFQGVDQAAAVLVVSATFAREYNLAEGVHVWSGAGALDTSDVLHRQGYTQSPAMRHVLQSALASARLDVSSLDSIDLYSCFPIVPKMASSVLGVSEDRDITVTGGLTSFGGPGNDYSLHALVTMTETLRGEAGTIGLVYGQGHYVTEHHAVVMSTSRPRAAAMVGAEPAVREPQSFGPPPEVVDSPLGIGTVETFTAQYDRAGTPVIGWTIGRDENGARFVAVTDEQTTLERLVDESHEPVGDTVKVTRSADGLNVFRFVE